MQAVVKTPTFTRRLCVLRLPLNAELLNLRLRQGSVGQQARDALLLIMSLSASDHRVAQHIIENTYFCPVSANTHTFPTSYLLAVNLHIRDR